MIEAALVLEGGALRSLYTAGVLDMFMEKNIEFSCVIGVSAGALTAANYISKQKYRSAKINILHSGDPKYYGITQFLTKRNAFNFKYLFHEPINRIYPFDTKALSITKQRFLICATDCNTGKPVYFENTSNYNIMTKFLQASSSIPLLADMVNINGRSYLDGGISEPIGIKKAINEKYSKIVVVLTREYDYDSSKSDILQLLFKMKYRHYPNLLKTLSNMSSNYNNLKITIDSMQKNSNLFVIRPNKSITVRRIEKNPRKLVDLYFQGREDAENNIIKMFKYLDKG